MIKASDKEWELAESIANEIQCKIHKHFMENVNPKYSHYCQVEILVPITEHINMEFMIHVPKEMMDEDNSTLLGYFVNHIYKLEDKYISESINAAIAERDAALLRLEENLKNFDPKTFFREREEDEMDSKSKYVAPSKFDEFQPGVLYVSSDNDECQKESGIILTTENIGAEDMEGILEISINDFSGR